MSRRADNCAGRVAMACPAVARPRTQPWPLFTGNQEVNHHADLTKSGWACRGRHAGAAPLARQCCRVPRGQTAFRLSRAGQARRKEPRMSRIRCLLLAIGYPGRCWPRWSAGRSAHRPSPIPDQGHFTSRPCSSVQDVRVPGWLVLGDGRCEGHQQLVHGRGLLPRRLDHWPLARGEPQHRHWRRRVRLWQRDDLRPFTARGLRHTWPAHRHPFQVTGGTGAFDGASGSGREFSSANAPTIVYEGTISF